ncbi:MAG: hypothetical protein O7F11_08095 [Acidobacteria bacterium]|jgi:hypothetical protein|nr:hypothetical protein [Acidobacteriota bacterium]MCZ6649123.1 hypothetical protein [Acidobacteriota bacterium]MCZ6745925.1 hypothetical protein [Acidobacteriota bacterium]MCZ6833692.1 hypothetical protein [Acidobacteriota bacterium]
MADKLKSAYELAMERLNRKDAEKGEGAPAALSAAQKKKIAAVRKEYEAKLAEREILYHAAQQEAAGDPDKLARASDDYRRDRDFVVSQREARLTAIREGND